MNPQKTNDVNCIGLDVGQTRIGVAIGHSSSKWCEPLMTVDRAQNRGEKKIIELIKEYAIETLVVGLPLSIDNSVTKESEHILKFIERLEKRIEIDIVTIDEWGSSEEAKQRLGISGSPERNLRKSGVIDAAAASIILRSFFDKGSS